MIIPMESSPLSNNEHQAMEHVNVGHEEVSNADAHTGAIFGMNALRKLQCALHRSV